MPENKTTEKYEYVLGALFLVLMLGSFITQKIYAVVSVYGTLIMFAALVVVCVMLTIKGREKYLRIDRAAVLCVIAAVIAPLNLIILHSGMGAVLIIFDLVLSLFLIIRGTGLSGWMKRALAFSGAALMLVWYPVVRWDYGFNMVGLIFIILMIFGEIFMEYLKNDMDLQYLKYVQILFFFTSILLAVCYQARSAALSMVVFGISYFAVPLIIKKRVFFNVWIFLFTAGSLIFTGLYVFLSTTGWNVRLLYKDVLSGRELIWSELWQEFIKRPLTGIGSSYEMKSFFIFEVHNGLLDILVVHGLPVFICIAALLVMALNRLFSRDLLFCPDKRLAFSGICTLLFASFFENGFIVTPYSCVFLVLMLICVS